MGGEKQTLLPTGRKKHFKKNTLLEARRTINLKELFGYQTGVPSTEVYRYTGYTGYTPPEI